MNKMAVFVEGYTEVVFVDKLIEEIAGRNSVLIQWRRISGGTNCPRTNLQIKAAVPASGQQHFVIIHDCGGDAAVKSRMIQEYSSLAKAGYSKIICIRDVHPDFNLADVPNLRASLPRFVSTKPILVDFILSIMEVEAWFLAEHSHFGKVDLAITVPAIVAALKFDPEHDDLQLRPTPANDLKACYGLAGKSYEKRNAQTTVDALDYAQIYAALGNRFPDLGKLCSVIEAFISK